MRATQPADRADRRFARTFAETQIPPPRSFPFSGPRGSHAVAGPSFRRRGLPSTAPVCSLAGVQASPGAAKGRNGEHMDTLDSGKTMHARLNPETDSRIREGLETAFFDADHPSDTTVRATFLANVPDRHKLLTDIRNELAACDSFAISVAFVTLGGLVPLLPVLEEIGRAGVRGRLLTTDYRTFTDPAALRRLLRLKNVETRLYRTRTDGNDGFHTKGYFFTREDTLRLVVGSANLTDMALTVSHEWNTRLVAGKEGRLAKQAMQEFDRLWTHSQSLPLDRCLDAYEKEYREAGTVRVLERHVPSEEVVPNAMQRAFLANFAASVQEGRPRVLLISATGTGKTYAAAFAMRLYRPRRLLFLVHREQIARQARKSFHRVLGGRSGDYGLWTGTVREHTRARCLFATMQTMVRHLDEFGPDEFDCILVDEVHRAGAPTYQTIMGHFRPSLWFGMTGSPDRPDGFDIYGLFDHNIVYEIRLQQALEEDLLCPFNYFGIGSLCLADREGLVVERDKGDFALLTSTEIVRHVLERASFYGYSGDRVKGLVFARDVRAARELAEGFNANGVKARALTGAESQDVRAEAVRRLTSGEGEDRLDYIITVDIFNEGVDLPEVNQIIFLRPTQSPIVFIQQLGRGLRRHPGKEFVNILDFIGAYETNFMIPMALTGDRSWAKDGMRRIVSRGTLPGRSTIYFDAVAKERIYRAIDAARTDSLGILKKAYSALKKKLGRVPGLLDYKEHGQIDAIKFLQKNTGWSYHSFLCRADREDCPDSLSTRASLRLAWLGRKLGNSLRPSEALVLRAILDGRRDLQGELRRGLLARCGFEPTPRHLRSVELVLTNRFERTADDIRHNEGMTFIRPGPDGTWEPDPVFLELLRVEPAFKARVAELLAFVLDRWQERYSHPHGDGLLCLGAGYSYEDVCRMLDWDRLLSGQTIGGYFYDAGTRTLPVFINYQKPNDAIPYEDRFLSPTHLRSLSKTNRTTDSEDARRMTRSGPYGDISILLFVRRNKDDGEAKIFTYLGGMDPAGEPVAVTVNEKPAFEIDWRLREPVEETFYTYLTGENI